MYTHSDTIKCEPPCPHFAAVKEYFNIHVDDLPVRFNFGWHPTEQLISLEVPHETHTIGHLVGNHINGHQGTCACPHPADATRSFNVGELPKMSFE